MESERRRPAFAAIGRSASTCVLIIGLYYLVPVEPGVTGTQMVVRALGTVVVGVLITALIVRQAARHLTDPGSASLLGLLTALVGGVAFFALADYITAMSGPGQFVGLATKTDALYFTLATLTTVGYGDIHAAGQAARAVVMVQLLFNVLVFTTAATVLTRQVRARAQERRRAGP